MQSGGILVLRSQIRHLAKRNSMRIVMTGVWLFCLAVHLPDRRFIDVMIKDSERYAETGGWGFEEFKGNGRTEGSLNAQERTACYSCHTGVKGHDFVFSAFRP
jgi:hypothetical protein